jgi:hypothetical protein
VAASRASPLEQWRERLGRVADLWAAQAKPDHTFRADVDRQVSGVRSLAARLFFASGPGAAQALALATDLGLRPLQTHCRLGLGKLYRRIDLVNDAHVQLSGAIAMLDDLEMRRWLPEANAELAAARE